MKKLYGIGVGPGDPDLLTIKGKKIMNTVDVLLCPVKKEGDISYAYEIIESHLENKEVEIKEVVYPMHYNQKSLEEYWKENGEMITELINSGKSCAFITLGDPTLYSTFMYTLPFVNVAECDIEIIPGITSFSAVASELNQALTKWDESLKIMPVQRQTKEELVKRLEKEDNIILMKPSRNSKPIVEALKSLGLEKNFKMITKVGRETSVIVSDIDVLENQEVPYLSTMLIKKGGFRD